MSGRPLVSAVIPVHNQAHFLGGAVASVWDQGLSNLEVVVVDDGSSDDVTGVLRAVERGPTQLIRQEWGGRSSARNHGILASRGRWIAFLDADDFWLPGKLDAQFEALAGGSEPAALVYCGRILVDATGRRLDSSEGPPSEALLERLLWGNLFTPSSVMAPKDLLVAVGMFDQDLHMGEDWDLWLRLTRRSRACHVREPLVAIRASTWEEKGYTRDVFEASTLRVLQRFFDTLDSADAHKRLARRKNRVFSWHMAVVAKTYLRAGRRGAFLRAALQSVSYHPLGLLYLIPRGTGVRHRMRR